jgi:hypothetical protein
VFFYLDVSLPLIHLVFANMQDAMPSSNFKDMEGFGKA